MRAGSLPTLSTQIYSEDRGTRSEEIFVLVLVLQVHIELCGFRKGTGCPAPVMCDFQGDPTTG